MNGYFDRAADLPAGTDLVAVTQRREAWWKALFSGVAARHPGIHWECGVDRIVIANGEKEVREGCVSGG